MIMGYKKNKHLVSALIRLIVVIIFVCITISLTTNTVITNEVALNQLNGGDEYYLLQEIYYRYKAIAPYIGAVLVIWASVPIIKIIYKHIKERKK